jgi:hypothetical protein
MSVPQGPFTAQVQRALGMLLNFPTASLPVAAPVGQIVFDTTTNTVKVTTDGSTWTAVGGSGVPTYPLLAPNGTAAAPSYSFSGDATSGLWRNGTNLTLSNSTAAFGINVSSTQMFVSGNNGTAAAPAISSSGGTTGMYFPGGNNVAFSTAGVAAFRLLGSGSIVFGAPDAAAPVAQTLSMQSVVAGTSNTAGQPFIIQPSISTGTGAGGEIQRAYAKTGASGTTQNGVTANAYNIPGTIFTVASAVNVNNSVAETSLLTGTLVGTATIEANTLRVGRAVHLLFRGIIGNTATPTFRARLTLGGTTLIDTTAFTTATITGSQGWKFECDLVAYTLGATGTIAASGMFFYDTALTSVVGIDAVNASTVTIDTTIAEAIDLKITWGAASGSNTVTLQTGYAVYLN